MFKIRERLRSRWDLAKKHLIFVLLRVGVLWGVYLFNFLLPESWGDLRHWGIRPRTFGGLVSIPVSGFIHTNVWHLLANTVPLVVLGWMLVAGGRVLFYSVCLLSALAAGAGAWVMGQGEMLHEGASGAVMGMLGFLLTRGWFGRKLLWAITAAAVGLFYLVELFSLLRNETGLSWALHFWGFAGGVGMAWWMHGRRAPVLLVPAVKKTRARTSNRARR